MKRKLVFIILATLLLLVSACKKEKIETHAHHWQPATYEEPEKCDCGKTRGEPLTPFAIEKGIIPDMEIGVKYPFYAKTMDKPELETKGSVKITRFRIIDNEGEEFMARAGYKWYITEFELVFAGIEAYRFGVSYDFLALDYYQELGYTRVFYIDWQGKNYICDEKYFNNSTWKKNTLIAKWTYGIRVPEGYDGGLLLFCSKDYMLSIIEEDQDGKFSDLAKDRAHCFRMMEKE